MAEFRLAAATVADLEGIWHFSRQRWGVDRADLYIDALTEAFAALAEAPKSAPACDDIRPGYRRRVVERHVVYFRIEPYGIAVIRVLHERMDAMRHV